MLTLVDPGEVGLLPMEKPRDGIHQHLIGGLGPEPTSLFEGQNPLDPAVAFVTGCPLRAFAPEHPKTGYPLKAGHCYTTMVSVLQSGGRQ